MGEDHLNVLSFQVNEGIQGSLAHVFRHQVQQAVLTLVGGAVKVEGEALLEVGVVLDHGFHKFHVEGIVVEHFLVRGEADEGAVLFIRGDNGGFQQVAACETCIGALAVAVGGHVEIHGHGVHGLGAHAVHAYALLEVGIVKLAAGVELGGGIHHFVERNAAAKVPHRHGFILNGDIDPAAVAHGEFIDGVVDDFLQEHIDAVSLAVSIAKSADIHAGTPPDVLVPFQGLDGVVVVSMVDCICHVIVYYPTNLGKFDDICNY